VWLDDCYDNYDDGCGCIDNCFFYLQKKKKKNNIHRYMTGVDAYKIHLESRNTYNPSGKNKDNKTSPIQDSTSMPCIGRTHLSKLRQYRKEKMKINSLTETLRPATRQDEKKA